MKGFEWTHKVTDRYLVTGRTVNGRPFRQLHHNPYIALSINLYDGRVWLIRQGKRILVKRVTV